MIRSDCDCMDKKDDFVQLSTGAEDKLQQTHLELLDIQIKTFFNYVAILLL